MVAAAATAANCSLLAAAATSIGIVAFTTLRLSFVAAASLIGLMRRGP